MSVRKNQLGVHIIDGDGWEPYAIFPIIKEMNKEADSKKVSDELGITECQATEAWNYYQNNRDKIYNDAIQLQIHHHRDEMRDALSTKYVSFTSCPKCNEGIYRPDNILSQEKFSVLNKKIRRLSCNNCGHIPEFQSYSPALEQGEKMMYNGEEYTVQNRLIDWDSGEFRYILDHPQQESTHRISENEILNENETTATDK